MLSVSCPMLGGAAPDLARGLAHLRGDAEGLDLAAAGLVHVLDPVATGTEMLVFIGGLGGIDGGARHARRLHDTLYLLGIVVGAPLYDLGVQLLALFGGHGGGTGGAVLVVEILQIKAHGRDAAVIHSRAEGADGDEEASLLLKRL